MNTFKIVYYNNQHLSYKLYNNEIEKRIILYDTKNNINKNIKSKTWWYSDYVRYFNSLPIRNYSKITEEELKIINS